MKRSRCSETQIIKDLKEAESGMPVAELCRRDGMSDGIMHDKGIEELLELLECLRYCAALIDRMKSISQDYNAIINS